MRVAIIGAGPAGITAAYELAKSSVKVEVYEASSQVGGLAKTIQLWNQKVDLGPHRFFSSDKRVNTLWLEVVGKEYRMVDRLTRIYYKNRYFHYPLKPLDALVNLGFYQASLCMLSYFKEKLIPIKQDGSFESWVTNRFGRKLFEIFFKTYSEKLWGISCKELDADFAAQRIKKLSLFEALKNAFIQGKNNKHKTLVDQFAYPVGGTGAVYERMASLIKEYGGNIFLNSPVQSVITKNNKIVGLKLANENIVEYDYIISSMPISLLVSRLPEVTQKVKEAAQSLKFRNTILVYLNVEVTNLFPDNWLYIHSTDLRMGRLTNFRNWTPDLYEEEKTSILALEYWCYEEDDFWKLSDQELISLAKKEVRSTGLIKDANIIDGFVYRINRCYPVYNKGYKENLKIVEEYLSSVQNLFAIGRYGAFKYNNQDHSILMGLLAAENILKGAKNDLWEINTDYESYQEASIITETGLKVQ